MALSGGFDGTRGSILEYRVREPHHAEVVKLVYTHVSGACGREAVGVQVPPSAFFHHDQEPHCVRWRIARFVTRHPNPRMPRGPNFLPRVSSARKCV